MSIPPRRASPLRIVADARTFFITSSTLRKRNLLQSDRSAGLFLRTLYDYRAQGTFRLHEFVGMPDHFHLLITVGADMTIERAVQFIKGGFAYRAGKELGMRPGFSQKGFSEVRILDVNEYDNVRDYIRSNPVKQHLALEPELYPYSSAYPGFELDPRPQGLKPVSKGEPGGMAKAIP